MSELAISHRLLDGRPHVVVGSEVVRADDVEELVGRLRSARDRSRTEATAVPASRPLPEAAATGDLSQDYGPMMGTEDVMVALGWSRTRVKTARDGGHLGSVRQVGKNWVYSRAAVEAFLSGSDVPEQHADVAGS